MPEQLPLYPYSRTEAQRNGDLDLWRESHEENIRCAEAIRTAILKNYFGSRLEKDAVEPVVKEFGYDRTFMVLARTVRRQLDDNGYSEDNKNWAKTISIPHDKENLDFLIKTEPAHVNCFLSLTREMYSQLQLLNRTHCQAGDLDYEGQVLVLKPEMLGGEYKTPDYQLFYAFGGFGCSPDAKGRKVMGQFLRDGEETNFRREDFVGVLKEEFLPEWAAEKLMQLQPPNEQEDGPTM